MGLATPRSVMGKFQQAMQRAERHLVEFQNQTFLNLTEIIYLTLYLEVVIIRVKTVPSMSSK